MVTEVEVLVSTVCLSGELGATKVSTIMGNAIARVGCYKKGKR